MKQRFNWDEVLQIFEFFELGTAPQLPARGMSVGQAREALEQIKKTFRRQRKKLAMRYHPDRGSDGERLKEINSMMDLIEQLRIVQPRPRPVMHVYYTYSTGSTSTSNCYWSTGD